jgi:purine-binding chemotaxis protein CheW
MMNTSPPDRALLETRARRLAEPVSAESDASHLDYLLFTLHGERCALEARLVCGTLRLTDFVPLPGSGIEVIGVTLWRGTLLRILDLARILGHSRTGLDDRAMVVAMGAPVPSLGLLVSTLSSVGRLPPAANANGGPQPEGSFVQHVTADAVQVLDGHALLSTFG